MSTLYLEASLVSWRRLVLKGLVYIDNMMYTTIRSHKNLRVYSAKRMVWAEAGNQLLDKLCQVFPREKAQLNITYLVGS